MDLAFIKKNLQCLGYKGYNIIFQKLSISYLLLKIGSYNCCITSIYTAMNHKRGYKTKFKELVWSKKRKICLYNIIIIIVNCGQMDNWTMCYVKNSGQTSSPWLRSSIYIFTDSTTISCHQLYPERKITCMLVFLIEKVSGFFL